MKYCAGLAGKKSQFKRITPANQRYYSFGKGQCNLLYECMYLDLPGGAGQGAMDVAMRIPAARCRIAANLEALI